MIGMKYPLSDDARRRMCRLAFLLVCVVPTTVVLYHIFHPSTPREWAQQIQSQLGLDVSIERVETPQPSMYLLRGVTVRDSEYRGMARLNGIRIELGSVRRVTIDEPVNLTSAGLCELLRRLPDYLLRPSADEGVWKVEWRQVTIDDAPDGAVRDHRTLSPVEVQVRRDSQQMVCLLRCRLLGQTSPGEPIEVLASRTRVGESWQESVRLSTGAAALPTWLVADLTEFLPALGDRCHFQGQLVAHRAPRGWNGELIGEFTQIDVDRVAQRAGLTLGGTGRVAVHRCDFHGDQIVSLQAALENQYGWIGPDVWQGLDRLMGLPRLASPDDRVAYSSLACGVRYMNGTIEISQLDIRDRQHVVLVGNGQGFCRVGIEQFARTLWGQHHPTSSITDSMVEFLHRFQILASPRAAEIPRGEDNYR